MKGQTYYSERVKGDPRNFNLSATFDVTDGYLGITQTEGETVKDRILLSPKQVKELAIFLDHQAARSR